MVHSCEKSLYAALALLSSVTAEKALIQPYFILIFFAMGLADLKTTTTKQQTYLAIDLLC